MKVLLGTLNAKFVHTNLALRYLEEAIKSETIVDRKEFTINEDQDGILYRILHGGYDIVAFSCYIWNINKILELASNIKKVEPRIKIILGGPEVSYESKELMEKNEFIDYIISGEGEESLRELIKALKFNGSYTEVSGLRYRKEEKIILNEINVLEDLSESVAAYRSVEYKEIENKIVYYETSRGCGYNCAYCLSSLDKSIRAYPMDRVKEELKKLVTLGAKQIKFVDRTFNYDKGRTLELLKYLIEIDDGIINFHFEITAFILDKEIVDILKSARKNLFQLEIGVQSTNPKTLEIVGRVNRIKEIKKWVNEIKSSKNIHIHLDLIAGLPRESYASFKNSFNETFGMLPDMLQLGFLKVLKGTSMHKMASTYGIIYRSTAPYEILKTEDISYFELNKLKEIEDILEKTYNNNHGKRVIEYLYKNEYKEDAFKIFEDIASIVRDEKLEKKKDWEYSALSYLCEGLECKEFLKDLLKFEYMQNLRGCGNESLIFEEKKYIKKEWAHNLLREGSLVDELEVNNLYFKELCKKVKWQFFRYDILLFIDKGKILKQDNLIFTNFESYNEDKQIYISSRRLV